ncbi:MAG: DUF4173 domain-containing protein [Lachnospiraceae bacterium]|nr:DUF4173 domain-containing protein [Lachnospiraceae bacterium]
MENNTVLVRETPGPVKVTQKREPDAEKLARLAAFGPYAALFAAASAFGRYKNPAGIACSLPVIVFFVLMRRLRDRGSSGAVRKASPMYVFSGVTCILLSVHVWTSASGVLQFLDRCGILILSCICLLQLAFDDAGWHPGMYLLQILKVILLPLRRLPIPFADIVETVRSRRESRTAPAHLYAVLKGLAAGVPILFVILLLLSDADAVFNRLIADLVGGFSLPSVVLDAVRLAALLTVSFIVFYTVSSSVFGKKEELSAEEGTSAGRRHDPWTAVTVCLLLCAVYVVFGGIQLVYLAGRRPLPQGLTYAQYAHEGFYQLAAVCVINLVIVTWCSERYEKSRLLSVLLLVMSLCTYSMIASSAYRMFLYIREYDLTFLRLFVLWFLLVLCIWFGFVCAGILKEDLPVFRSCVIAAAVLYLVFAFAHPDYHIARYNMSAAGRADRVYLAAQLSDDAVPALARDPELIALRRKYKNSAKSRDSFGADPRKFNLSSFIASRY